jgi:hypothetical protein
LERGRQQAIESGDVQRLQLRVRVRVRVRVSMYYSRGRGRESESRYGEIEIAGYREW